MFSNKWSNMFASHLVWYYFSNVEWPWDGDARHVPHLELPNCLGKHLHASSATYYIPFYDKLSIFDPRDPWNFPLSSCSKKQITTDFKQCYATFYFARKTSPKHLSFINFRIWGGTKKPSFILALLSFGNLLFFVLTSTSAAVRTFYNILDHH